MDALNALPAIEALPLYGGRKASASLDIIVVGAGLGGLSTAFCLAQAGHNVAVVEATTSLGEVGAGIQISPNVTRLLFRWGLKDELTKVVVEPSGVSFRRYLTGELVGRTLWGNRMLQDHDAPYYHIHRADYQQLLYRLVKPWIKVHWNSRVTFADPTHISITLQNGETLVADMIIGADGIKSKLRETVAGCTGRPVPTGDAAYRAVIPTEQMHNDPDLKHLVDETEMAIWMGPKKHVVGYCLRAKKEYNLVMLHPDEHTGQASSESWTAEASVEQMRNEFVGWEPRVQKLLGMVKSTLNWKLLDRDPLDRWVHENGRIALMGDACHPMLPYRAQGAAMATEDAITLGVLFSHITDRTQIGPLLHAYQRLRHARATTCQLDSRMNQRNYHLEDGPEQEARDAAMREVMSIELLDTPSSGEPAQATCANLWADKDKSKLQFSYDAEAVAEEWWNAVGKYEIGSAGVEKHSRRVRVAPVAPTTADQ